jgi:hypothetical protein
MTLLAAWSWRKWPDPFVDFGHELYVPWQLSEGRVLYRDIEYFMGPFSQYLNGLMFAAFGASLTTLIWTNLLILAGIVAVIDAIFRRAVGRGAGLVTAATFLCVFAFAQYVGTGNYNYVTPYLHEQTHGVALGLAVLLLLSRAATNPSRGNTFALGATLGLTFLTKAEAFVPALAGVLVGSVLLFNAYRPSGRHVVHTAATFTIAFTVPVAAALGFLAAQMPFSTAVRGVAGNWVYLLNRDLTINDPYYAHNLGTAAMGTQALEILEAVARVAAFGLAAVILERLLRGRDWRSALAGGLAVGVILLVATDVETWLDMARVLPVVACSASCVFAVLCWRRRNDPLFRSRFTLAVWSVFAFASLGKMMLRPRFGHYGFALAMPATLLLVALLLFVVPRVLRGWGSSGEAWRAASAAAVLVAVGSLLHLSSLFYSAKTVAVGSGSDLFYTLDARIDPRGEYFVDALNVLQRDMSPEANLLVLPDGALLNFLLRRPNPTPYYLVTPWELRAFGGEEAVFARIAPAPPDYVVLAKVDMSEYGPRFFGFDPTYGQRLRLWLEHNYLTVATVGHEPIMNRPWLRIYRRRDDRATSVELPAVALGS